MKAAGPAVALLVASALAGAGCDYRRPAAMPAGVVASGASAIEQATDYVLADRLQAALERDPITSDADIQVSVARGRVRLGGFVDSAAAKLRAGVLATETEGVVSVDNRLIQRHHAGVTPDPIRGARVHL